MEIPVYRTEMVITDEIRVGDKINVMLGAPFDRAVKATAQLVDGQEVTFLFDEILAMMPWYDIGKWFIDVLQPAMMPGLPMLSGLSIPTVGQLFGKSDEWANGVFELDDKPQFELMKNDFSRVAEYQGKIDWYWMKNKRKASAPNFAYIYFGGSANGSHASNAVGVRPVFTLTL